jgi:phospholipid-binding lipoprotein MlaA
MRIPKLLIALLPLLLNTIVVLGHTAPSAAPPVRDVEERYDKYLEDREQGKEYRMIEEAAPPAPETPESAEDSPLGNEKTAQDEEDDFDSFADDFGGEFDDGLADELIEPNGGISDPVKLWNKGWFHFNDRLFFWGLKPFSKGYGFILPRPLRLGLDNVFTNLAFPRRFFNNAFQAKPKRSGIEFGRFLVNTTVGIGGLFDPATHWLHWEIYDEDFDQTLGLWRLGQGVFLTWPFIGPSSLRGTLALPFDMAMDGAAAIPGGGLLRQVNLLSLRSDPYESLLEVAIDPYISVRNAYVQNRKERTDE